MLLTLVLAVIAAPFVWIAFGRIPEPQADADRCHLSIGRGNRTY